MKTIRFLSISLLIKAQEKSHSLQDYIRTNPPRISCGPLTKILSLQTSRTHQCPPSTIALPFPNEKESKNLATRTSSRTTTTTPTIREELPMKSDKDTLRSTRTFLSTNSLSSQPLTISIRTSRTSREEDQIGGEMWIVSSLSRSIQGRRGMRVR